MKAKKKKGLNERYNWFDYLNVVIMVMRCLSLIFPFWDMLMRSLSDASGSESLTFVFWPINFNLQSYKYLLKDSDVIVAYGVSIARTVCGTLISLALVMLAAYPLSKKDLPYRKVLTLILLVTMFFSGGLIPSYLVNKKLGLDNNFLVYILPGSLSVYNLILVRNYMMTLDNALEESAFIDGAGYGTILVKVLAPLTKPIMATIALYVAVGQWNSWFDSLIYAKSKNLEVMQLLLRRLLNATEEMTREMEMYALLTMEEQATTTNSVRMACTLITVVPIMCVYPFVQKHFVKGIMVGSLKG